MNIGSQLKELRLQQKLSLEQLARRVGLTRSFLSQVEKDKASPSITSLIKILGALFLLTFIYHPDGVSQQEFSEHPELLNSRNLN